MIIIFAAARLKRNTYYNKEKLLATKLVQTFRNTGTCEQIYFNVPVYSTVQFNCQRMPIYFLFT